MAAPAVLATLVQLVLAVTARPAVPDTARFDTVRVSSRVVRTLPVTEVWASLHDYGSSETVQLMTSAQARALPVDNLADLVGLQAGVVAQGEEVHVRGGRPGTTTTILGGIGLNEPRLGRAMELPLFAVRSADLVSGGPEAMYGAGLAGALAVRTLDPGRRPTLAWRWQSALGERWYDRWALGGSTPLPVLGLGLAAATDLALDDSWLPDLRSDRRQAAGPISFDWRADNHLLGWVKLAPVAQPSPFSLEYAVSRRLQRPYDRAWTTVTVVDPSGTPSQPDWRPGYVAYRAADHVGITDLRQNTVIATLAGTRGSGRGSLGAGWLRTREVTSPTGERSAPGLPAPVGYGNSFDVIAGDWPLYRESGSDQLTLRADAEVAPRPGRSLKGGGGVSYEDVSLDERDYAHLEMPYDHFRSYHAYAPGGFGYVQGRWESGGLLLNPGVRAEYWTPGRAGRGQTLPWNGRGTWSFSPRLGITYPISVRDAFSLSYVRIAQPPARDYLYDERQANPARVPLGNPGMQPATVISYELAVKHTFDVRWAMQAAAFYRDLYGEVGVRDVAPADLPATVAYESADDGHVGGVEWSLLYGNGPGRRFELHYTYLDAWGVESNPSGDPYGAVIGSRVTPSGTTPLSWDRRHSLQVAWVWPWHDDWTVSWSTSVGSPLPWTPKAIRAPLLDYGVVNSRRLGWEENTSVNVDWKPPFAHGLTVGLEARNLFDHRGERAVTVDGYPNAIVNTEFDDYGAYRTATGLPGGAFWFPMAGGGVWVPVHDPRLFDPPRAVRVSVGAHW